MNLAHRFRSPIVALIAAAGLSTPTYGWDPFCKDSKTVKLPPQRVTIQTSEPHVTIRDRTRVGVTPVVGTLYMPLAMPLTGFGFPMAAAPVSAADDSLSKALEAEQHTIRAASALASFKAEIEAKQMLMQRLSSPATPPTAAGKTCADSSKHDQQIQQISDTLKRIDERLTAVEKLLVIHDNYLREKLEKEDPNKDGKTPMERIGPPNPKDREPK